MAASSTWTLAASSVLRLQFANGMDEGLGKSYAVEYAPMFEDDAIFGYKDLRINMIFSGARLRLLLDVSYGGKVLSGPKPADDIFALLTPYLPQDCVMELDELLVDDASFTPPGTMISSYAFPTNPDVSFQVYKMDSTTAGFKSFAESLEFIALLTIDGASLIDYEDPRWSFYTLFSCTQRSDTSAAASAPQYLALGFCSLYKFYAHPDAWRLRISQFVILPPYQRCGHGSKLYEAIVANAASMNDVVEVCVEDPNDAFADMRDRVDLKRMRSSEANLAEKLHAPVSDDVMRGIRCDFKLNKRQAERCVEMLMLDKDRAQKRQKSYRTQVKTRLFKFNADQLGSLPVEERVEKLDETYSNVVADYERVLDGLS